MNNSRARISGGGSRYARALAFLERRLTRFAVVVIPESLIVSARRPAILVPFYIVVSLTLGHIDPLASLVRALVRVAFEANYGAAVYRFPYVRACHEYTLYDYAIRGKK